jgi:two-component system cell cycle response regulator DivK
METLRTTDARRPLVLIVEDDLSTRVLYRDYISQCGFRIADAHNGRQALEKAFELHPDAVVTDLAVPGLDGFEFCRALQRSAGTRAIPILAVTGHSEYAYQIDRIRQAGISQVLMKPCDPDRIVQALQRLLAAPSSVTPTTHSATDRM